MRNNTSSLALRIFRFYRDGFRSMTWGRTLWVLILVKLFIIFIVLRLLFFPKFLSRFDTDAEKEDYVSRELTDRGLKVLM